jgi:hypothetical protein
MARKRETGLSAIKSECAFRQFPGALASLPRAEFSAVDSSRVDIDGGRSTRVLLDGDCRQTHGWRVGQAVVNVAVHFLLGAYAVASIFVFAEHPRLLTEATKWTAKCIRGVAFAPVGILVLVALLVAWIAFAPAIYAIAFAFSHLRGTLIGDPH